MTEHNLYAALARIAADAAAFKDARALMRQYAASAGVSLADEGYGWALYEAPRGEADKWRTVKFPTFAQAFDAWLRVALKLTTMQELTGSDDDDTN
jgi:hypothetical protein